MTNLDQVVSSIKSMSKEQLKEVYDAYAIRMSEVRHNEKSSFKIGVFFLIIAVFVSLIVDFWNKKPQSFSKEERLI